MPEKTYIEGLFIKNPSEKAPEFVLAKGSINTAKMKAMLAECQDEWINFDILKSKKGEVYAKLNTWKKGDEQKKEDTIEYPAAEDYLQDVPF